MAVHQGPAGRGRGTSAPREFRRGFCSASVPVRAVAPCPSPSVIDMVASADGGRQNGRGLSCAPIPTRSPRLLPISFPPASTPRFLASGLRRQYIRDRASPEVRPSIRPRRAAGGACDLTAPSFCVVSVSDGGSEAGGRGWAPSSGRQQPSLTRLRRYPYEARNPRWKHSQSLRAGPAASPLGRSPARP